MREREREEKTVVPRLEISDGIASTLSERSFAA